LEVLARTGPMAVSSANRHGQPPALSAQQAREQLGEDVAIYLDGGPAAIGVASSIVDVTHEIPRLLRAGAVSVDALREVLPALEIAG
jgi:L-threonylcarbamoyladenylate synthase